MAITYNGNDLSATSDVAYGTCATAAATAAKVVNVVDNPNWKLKAGSIIVVKSTNTNTAQNPTLNVNGTGAKSVWYNTGNITTSSLNKAGHANRPIIYMYNGSVYVFLGWAVDSDTTYSNSDLGNGYATCSTAAATVAKTATLSGYTLTANGTVAVKFTYDVPASATLNINSKGAKPIYYRGAAITAGVINAGDIGYFIYNGSQYCLITTDRSAKTFGAATASAAGTMGLVPAPAAGENDEYLRGDGTWATPTNTTYSAATTSANGLMTSAMVTKLNGIATGANKTTVDSAMSSSSTNPVQNKVVNTALSGKAPTSHASTATTYGVGTTSNYGHCMTINNVTTSAHANGKALSAYQGYLLANRLANARKVWWTSFYSDVTIAAGSTADVTITITKNDSYSSEPMTYNIKGTNCSYITVYAMDILDSDRSKCIVTLRNWASSDAIINVGVRIFYFCSV